MLDVLKALCEKLEYLEIEYMLSGSLALNLYTVPRMTRDIDIIIHFTDKNLESFISSFDSDYFVDDIGIRQEVKRKGIFNLIHKATALRIDCIVMKNEPYRGIEFGRRVRNEEYGFPIWVVTKEDLIISKLAWIQKLQSDKQMEDIKHLLATTTIDFDYIKEWTTKLNLNTFTLLSYE